MKTIQGRVVATCEKCGHEAPEEMMSRFGCPVCWEKEAKARVDIFWGNNPNATAREYKKWLDGITCEGCHMKLADDDVVWATMYGVLSTTHKAALPWCVACCPEENVSNVEGV